MYGASGRAPYWRSGAAIDYCYWSRSRMGSNLASLRRHTVTAPFFDMRVINDYAACSLEASMRLRRTLVMKKTSTSHRLGWIGFLGLDLRKSAAMQIDERSEPSCLAIHNME
jgi:hypothetical protein